MNKNIEYKNALIIASGQILKEYFPENVTTDIMNSDNTSALKFIDENRSHLILNDKITPENIFSLIDGIAGDYVEAYNKEMPLESDVRDVEFYMGA